MLKNCNTGQRPQAVNLLTPAKTYLHSWALRQWLLRKEKSFEEPDGEKTELRQDYPPNF